MPEPRDPLTMARLQATQAKARMIRTVDLPAIGPDTRVGTLHIRPRPVEAPKHLCRECGKPYKPTRGQKYCSPACMHEYVRKTKNRSPKHNERTRLNMAALRARERAEKEGATE